ncbi:DUF302 domain-containing protein [Henriciella sp.]|uniref:DUF302 domain-containing protein n=1 Tax=Henriciella sp. TaxID=1968823 RepID=UPI0026050F57|nr:DUF302 domain-containing protein [Henriciella sp.]
MKHPLALAALTLALTGACISAPEEEAKVAETYGTDQPAPQMNLSTDSANSFDVTEARLRQAIESRGLTLFKVVDHAQGAQEAGLKLSSSTLFIFANPEAGTPLMQANPAMGIELPMKILVIETDNGVQVLWKDVPAMAERYAITDKGQVVQKVAQTLQAIVDEASQ